MIGRVRASDPRRRRAQRASAWARAHPSLAIVGDLVVDDRVEIGDHCEISKEHVDIGAIALFVSFASGAHASMGSIKS